MDHAVRTHTDGDLPPRRERFASPRAFAVWTLGTWAWRLAMLAALVVVAFFLYDAKEIARDGVAQLAGIKDRLK